MGRADIFPPMVNMMTTAALRVRERRTFVRVRVIARDGALIAEPMRAQGSGVTTSMAGAIVPVLMIGAIR